MIEMEVDSVRISSLSNQYVVLLKEKAGERYLPIWIGSAEAQAISLRIQDIHVPRPLTHDLILSIISVLGAGLE
jgi:uncharacterized protein